MIDHRDKEMMCIASPLVDYWEMREDLDRLEGAVIRLERIVQALIELYRVERVKNWEMILQAMLNQKGNRDDRAG